MQVLYTFAVLVVLHSALGVPLQFDSNEKTVAEDDQLLTRRPFAQSKVVRAHQDDIPVRGPEPLLFEGDIAGVIGPGDTVLDLNDKLHAMEKGANFNKVWGSADFYYYISSSFSTSERNTILQAMRDITAKTDAIQFFERTTQTNYIYIMKGNGCYSYVGKKGGPQDLSLGTGCVYTGIIIHELMHAIGFWHEQSRTDRDSYVEINWGNIAEDQKHNFNKYGTSEMTTSGTSYDFGSIMHYESTAFAINSAVWTLRPKSPWHNVAIGQRNGMSANDIREINIMYKLCATLWTAPNYSGSLYKYMKGESANLPASAGISSAKVTFGCSLVIYSQRDYQGSSWRLRPTQEGYVYWNFEGQPYDNVIMSAKCTCP